MSLDGTASFDATVLSSDRLSEFPVAVVDIVPSYRLGLSAAFADAGFRPEEPADLDDWARLPGPRGVLVTVTAVEDCQGIQRLVAENDELIVVALLRQPTPEMYVRALQAGASGVASWTSAPETVIEVMRSARQEQVLLPHDVVKAIATGITLSAELRSIAPAELHWLQVMAKGQTVAELARAVGYSEREMFRLLRQLYERMGVQNRTEALLKAAQCGLLA